VRGLVTCPDAAQRCRRGPGGRVPASAPPTSQLACASAHRSLMPRGALLAGAQMPLVQCLLPCRICQPRAPARTNTRPRTAGSPNSVQRPPRYPRPASTGLGTRARRETPIPAAPRRAGADAVSVRCAVERRVCAGSERGTRYMSTETVRHVSPAPLLFAGPNLRRATVCSVCICTVCLLALEGFASGQTDTFPQRLCRGC
jgi:hypothetical protein